MLNLLNALKNQYKITDSEEIKFFLDLKESIDQSWENGRGRHRLRQIIEEGRYYHRDKLITRRGYVVGLDLSRWSLAEVPESIGNLKHLKTLDLSYNQFKTLPDSMENLISLTNLSLNGNFNLEKVPSSITTLAQTIFAKKYIKQGVVPKDAEALALLEILSGIDMKIFPEGKKLGDLNPIWHHYRMNEKGSITEIYLEHYEFMQIVIFPHEICNLKNLEVLRLAGQRLKSIPNCITRLKKLKILDLSFNNITSIPDYITQLKKLKLLDLRRNNITSIPSSISEKNLRLIKI